MVVVFDGVCNFCNGWVRFLLKRDRRGVLQFAPAQSAFGAKVLLENGERPDDPSTIILVDGVRHYLRSEAILRTVAALGGGWRLAMLGLLAPRPIRDAAYLAFGRRRYRWFGKSESCPVPDPAWRSRFIT
jgi:predicted DCC family thiol-disulfide oxidoreductase YuxK